MRQRCLALSNSFIVLSIHSVSLLHAGQHKASVLAPRYSCAGVFHPVTKPTALPKHGAEEVMGNTLGDPLQEDAQQGAWWKAK